MLSSNKPLPDEVFLAYLKEYRPYLFDIEALINKMAVGTGYGTISITLHMTGGKIDRGSSMWSEDKVYIFRDRNKL